MYTDSRALYTVQPPSDYNDDSYSTELENAPVPGEVTFAWFGGVLNTVRPDSVLSLNAWINEGQNNCKFYTPPIFYSSFHFWMNESYWVSFAPHSTLIKQRLTPYTTTISPGTAPFILR